MTTASNPPVVSADFVHGIGSIDGLVAPDSAENKRRCARYLGAIVLALAGLALVGTVINVAVGARLEGYRPAGLLAFAAVGVAGSLVGMRVAERLPLWTFHLVAAAVVVAMSAACAFAGEYASVYLLGYVAPVAAASVLMRRWMAAGYAALAAALHATALTLTAGSEPVLEPALMLLVNLVAVGSVANIVVHRVRVQAVTGRRARTALEAATRRRAEFLSRMSHELRTPLNAIIGFADALRQGLAGPLDRESEVAVSGIQARGARLTGMIERLLVSGGLLSAPVTDEPAARQARARRSVSRSLRLRGVWARGLVGADVRLHARGPGADRSPGAESHLVRLSVVLACAAAAAAAVLVVAELRGVELPGLRRQSLLVLAAVGVASALALAALRRHLPEVTPLVLLVAASGAAVLVAHLAGSFSPLAGAGFTVLSGAAFVTLTRLAAGAVVAAFGVGYAFVLALQPYHPGPVGRWLGVMGVAVIVGVAISWLVERLRERADAEMAVREQLEHIDRHQSDFVAAVRSDLRAPLIEIEHQCRALADGGHLGEQQLEYLRDVHGAARHLRSIVDDFLVLAQTEADELELRPSRFSVADLVREVVDDCHDDTDTHWVAVETQVSGGVGAIEADRRHLRHALGNVLANALKFTPPGGRVVVSARRADDDVVVEVADTGRGVDPRDRERVFGEFEQSGPIRGPRPGPGLGLAVVAHLVRLHGGTVRVEPREGPGTCVVVTLPVRLVARTARLEVREPGERRARIAATDDPSGAAPRGGRLGHHRLGVRSLDATTDPGHPDNVRAVAMFGIVMLGSLAGFRVVTSGIDAVFGIEAPDYRPGLLLLLTGAGVLTALAVIGAVGLRSLWFLHVLGVGAVLGTTGSVALAGALEPVYALGYVALVGTVFGAMTVPYALGYLALCGAAYGAVLSFSESALPATERWLLLMTAAVFVGIVIRWLVRQVQVQAAREGGARVQVDAASERTSRFLARMSHEMRTPLNSIIGFADALRTGIAGPVTDQQAEYLADIGGSAHHLLELVDDVVDLSRVESGRARLEPETIEVAPALESVVRLFREQSLRRRVAVEVAVGPSAGRLHADPRAFRQIIVNLVSNAVKFTPAGGRVEVRTSSPDGRTVEVAVADDGPGISAEALEHIFDDFTQVHDRANPATEDLGTGLGLGLVRRLVDLHGGRLDVASTVGEGSTFRVHLPVEGPQRRDGARAPAGRPADRGPLGGRGRLVGALRAGLRHHGTRSIDGQSHPTSDANRVALARLGAVFTAGLAVVLAIHAFGGRGVDPSGFERGTIVVMFGVGVAVGAAVVLAHRRMPLWGPPVLLSAAAVLGVLFAWWSGPLASFAGATFLVLSTVAYASLSRLAAAAPMAVLAAGYAVVLAGQPHHPAPFSRWVGVIGTTAVVGLATAWLVDRVQALALSERAARAEAAMARRNKSEFLAQMSHELRTPLNSIIGFADVLAQGVAGPLVPRQRSYVGDISESGAVLLSLINDVLDLSKVEAGRMDLDRARIPIGSLLEEAAASATGAAGAKGLELTVDVEPGLGHLDGDAMRLRQVLDGLLSNAVGFTQPGGWVTLSARRSTGAGVEISVADNGPGIHPDDHDAVFEDFTRSTTPSEGGAGTGLGLALARRLVQLHGGWISVDSALGRGATFTVWLPVASREELSPA